MDLNLYSMMDLDKMHAWELYSAQLGDEMLQSADEGLDVAQYARLAEDISELPRTPIREELADVFWKAIVSAPMRVDYPYQEPSDLPGIQAARPANRAQWKAPARDEALIRKMRGAWLGRVCGCLLGKPIEGWRTPSINKLLQGSDNFPLKRYIHSKDLEAAGMEYVERTWIDRIDGIAPVDDDTNYTVIGSRVIEKYGRGFTPKDMAELWMALQAKHAYCTAERRAYLSFVAGIVPPHSAVYKNPGREYIGAQIRADYFGYINPGDPETAADMAWRDACISHVKNGIYGEMFVAAMLAVAAVCGDVKTVIRAGLEQIPQKSRLTEAVERVIAWYEEGVTQEECFRRIHELYDENKGYYWVHTIPNAVIVAAALLYGEKDYARSICMAVQTGFDTDCNGATVGSVLGMMLGDEGIPAQWSEPIHGKLRTSIFGMDCVSLDELAEMTISHMA